MKTVIIPAEVGQTIYRVWSCGKHGYRVAEFTVKSIELNSKGSFIYYCNEKKGLQLYRNTFEEFKTKCYVNRADAAKEAEELNYLHNIAVKMAAEITGERK